MSTKTAKPELYAFWKYDSFPYLLGGTVTRMDERGNVETEEFGINHWFRPIKLVPVKHGRMVNAALKALEGAFRSAHDDFLDDWDRRVPTIADFAVVPAKRAKKYKQSK